MSKNPVDQFNAAGFLEDKQMYSIEAQRQALERRIQYFQSLNVKAELEALRKKLQDLRR